MKSVNVALIRFRSKQLCMICYDYTAFQIIKSECESQTQFICHFLPIKCSF